MEKNKTKSGLFTPGNRKKTTAYLIVIVGYVVLQLMSNAGMLSSLLKGLLIPTCCYIIAALGLNLNVGISGELNLGQAGFMSVGAFTAIIVSGAMSYAGISSAIVRLIVAVIIGIVVSGLFGYLIGIPVLKLRGDYLAIVTLAFGQIIMSLINNVYLGIDGNGFHFSFVNNDVVLEQGKMLLQGPKGASGTERIATFAFAALLVLIALIVIFNTTDSRFGRAIMSTRDNRIASESVGINVAKTKMRAFVISSALAGAAGAIYGLNYATLTPGKFGFNQSIMILVYVVLGGLGNMTGTIVSTIVLVLLPELMHSLQDYRMIIYSVVLILVMRLTNSESVKRKLESFRNKKKEGGVEHE